MENYKNYLIDLVAIQIKKLNDLENDLLTCSEQDKDYLKGQIMAYYDSLTTMKYQAELFDVVIPFLEEDGLNLERYLSLK